GLRARRDESDADFPAVHRLQLGIGIVELGFKGKTHLAADEHAVVALPFDSGVVGGIRLHRPDDGFRNHVVVHVDALHACSCLRVFFCGCVLAAGFFAVLPGRLNAPSSASARTSAAMICTTSSMAAEGRRSACWPSVSIRWMFASTTGAAVMLPAVTSSWNVDAGISAMLVPRSTRRRMASTASISVSTLTRARW